MNRKFENKKRGLVVDYIGIKKQMNLTLAHYSKADSSNIEEIESSIIVVRDHLDLLARIFHQFDTTPYFSGSPVEQLQCLNRAAEFVQLTDKIEKRVMFLVKRLKAAYDIKAELKVDLIILLAENGYPPVDRDEVYKEIFEQAENFKKNRVAP
jgi:type I restriction enzyme R subunit